MKDIASLPTIEQQHSTLAGRLWRWQERRMVGIWLGIPIAFGLVFSGDTTSDFAGIGKAVQSAPRFTREGLISRPDARGRTLLLTMKDGKKQRIWCDMEQTSSACIDWTKYYPSPVSATVTLFQFKGFWIIVKANETGSNIPVVVESKQIKSLLYYDSQYRHSTPFANFTWGIIVSYLTVVPFLIIFTLIKRIRARRSSTRSMRNADR